MMNSIARGLRFTSKRAYFFSKAEEFTPQQLSKSQKHVEQTLRSRTWVTYMLASYLPSGVRPAFYAINLFDMELSKIVENARDPALALGKLNFWTESIHQIYAGKKPQPQPISITLHHAIHNNPLTNGYFHRMIKVRGKQISNRSISTISEMRVMADDSKGTILALTLELLRIQITNDHMREAISYLGQAIGICEYLRKVPYALRNNRFQLPEEVLTKYNLTLKNIWDRVYGKPSEELFDAALEIASYAKKAFEQATKIYKTYPQSFPQHTFRAFLRGVQTQYYLENLEKYNFNLFDQNLNNVSPIKLPYRVYNAAKSKQFWVGMETEK